MGVKTLYEYFYKLAYGDKGADKATLVNDCLDKADAEIKANKDAKHTQGTDQGLDTGGANAVVVADVKDAVTKKHTQGTDYSNIVICADYDHPDDAITAIGADNKTLLVTEAETCDTDFTVPANVKVRFERGGKWTINDGITVTFNGQIDAGLWQIFAYAGTGTLNFGTKILEVYPEWWAVNTTPGTTDMKDAIQYAVDSFPSTGGTVKFGATTYLIKGEYETLANASRLTDGVKIKSNMTFRGEGNSSIIRQDENCCFSFTTRLLTAVTDPATNVKNVAFYNLQFDKPDATWFQQSHLLNMESVTNLTIRDCSFIEWSGDAICLGYMTNGAMDDWLQSYVRNVIIDNNIFDGVTKANRQALTFMCGENVSINNNYFTRTTRTDMPGAIDFEPTKTWCLMKNVNIEGNTFEDIDGLAVVSFALSSAMTVGASNVSVLNNIFKDNVADYEYTLIGLVSADPVALVAQSPERFRFAGNIMYTNTTRVMQIGGAKDVTIENETIVCTSAVRAQGLLAYSASNYLPIEGFYFKNNTIRDWAISGTIYEAPFEIYGAILGGEISGNKFIDCGNYTGGAYGNMTCISFHGANPSYGVKIEGNSFINNDIYSVNSFPIYVPTANPLVNPTTFSLRDNSFLYGFSAVAYTSAASIYAICPSDRKPNVSQISFPATQVPSANKNTLDDYEEDEWTMGVSFGGNAVGVTTATNTGYYTKIGNIVTISGQLQLTSKGTSTGVAVLTGLPFTCVNDIAGYAAAALVFYNISFANQFQGFVTPNTNNIELIEITEAGTKTNLDNTNFADNSIIRVNCTYRCQ